MYYRYLLHVYNTGVHYGYGIHVWVADMDDRYCRDTTGSIRIGIRVASSWVRDRVGSRAVGDGGLSDMAEVGHQ